MFATTPSSSWLDCCLAAFARMGLGLAGLAEDGQDAGISSPRY